MILLALQDMMLQGLSRSVLLRPLMQVVNFPHFALLLWSLRDYLERIKNVYRS